MRAMTSAALAEAEAGTLRPVIMALLEFDSAVVAVHSGVGRFTFDGNEYVGIGDLGSITGIEENSNMGSPNVSMTLSGVEPAYVSLALNVEWQGRPATVYVAFFDSSMALIADPVIVFRGRMEQFSVQVDKTATISVECRNRLADWNRPRISRFNNADQQARHAGDRGLEFVEQATERPLYWGVKF